MVKRAAGETKAHCLHHRTPLGDFSPPISAPTYSAYHLENSPIKKYNKMKLSLVNNAADRINRADQTIP